MIIPWSSQIAKKCKLVLGTNDNDLDTNLEIYYDTWEVGAGDEDFILTLTFIFEKEDFVSKNVE